MFDGEWKRCQSDTTEQLAKVLGIVTKSGVANDIMFEMLDSYVKADLTTNIDEDDDHLKISRRFWFSDDRDAEEQEVEFEFGKTAYFPSVNGDTIEGQFNKKSPVLIQGNEGSLKVKYRIQDGRLVEELYGNGFYFKQVSKEKLHTSKLFIP